jgi:hypothetical protein
VPLVFRSISGIGQGALEKPTSWCCREGLRLTVLGGVGFAADQCSWSARHQPTECRIDHHVG